MLWVPTGSLRDSSGKLWRVSALCENPTCWHVVAGSDGLVSTAMSEYFALLAPVVELLTDGIACHPEALSELEAGKAQQSGPVTGKELAALLHGMMSREIGTQFSKVSLRPIAVP
jgi:hypothetical protein